MDLSKWAESITGLFRNITHLELLEYSTMRATEIGLGLENIRNLTHVAFNLTFRDPTLTAALRANTSLRRVVFLALDFGDDGVRDDERFVYIEEPVGLTNWLCGAYNGADFWAVAETIGTARTVGKVVFSHARSSSVPCSESDMYSGFQDRACTGSESESEFDADNGGNFMPGRLPPLIQNNEDSGDSNIELPNVTNGHFKAFKAFDGPSDRLEDLVQLLDLQLEVLEGGRQWGLSLMNYSTVWEYWCSLNLLIYCTVWMFEFISCGGAKPLFGGGTRRQEGVTWGVTFEVEGRQSTVNLRASIYDMTGRQRDMFKSASCCQVSHCIARQHHSSLVFNVFSHYLRVAQLSISSVASWVWGANAALFAAKCQMIVLGFWEAIARDPSSTKDSARLARSKSSILTLGGPVIPAERNGNLDLLQEAEERSIYDLRSMEGEVEGFCKEGIGELVAILVRAISDGDIARVEVLLQHLAMMFRGWRLEVGVFILRPFNKKVIQRRPSQYLRGE
ncbi:hypothetical protein B0H11DRAFT_1935727 [Mycena galericulata]|nr:hypothetical protein B0H11DRAFT_1935727 [Mycena galericulata]